jgi:hypothetical protein
VLTNDVSSIDAIAGVIIVPSNSDGVYNQGRSRNEFGVRPCISSLGKIFRCESAGTFNERDQPTNGWK